MKLPSTIGAAGAVVIGILFLLSAAALAERLLWLHTGPHVLGSINLDSFPNLRGLCPATSAWAEVKESGTPGLFAYRCEDGSWLWPLPTHGRSSELQRLWHGRIGPPPAA